MSKTYSRTCLVLGNPGKRKSKATNSIFQDENGYLGAIQEVCDDIGIHCVTIIELLHSDVTISELRESIQSADILVVEVSGLTADLDSVVRERAEAKPDTAIFISANRDEASLTESEDALPLDYQHPSGDIPIPLKRKRLSKAIRRKLEEIDRLHSPSVHGRLSIEDKQKQEGSLESFSAFVQLAEAAKSSEDFSRAKALFAVAYFLNDRDDKIIQRLCLVTYKQDESSINALREARGIIEALKPKKSEDPETIGLCGAINKRLFDVTGNKKYFDESLWFYNRGYEVKKDYYNGVNLAFTYNRRAAKLAKSKAEATEDFNRAETIRQEVLNICLAIVDEPSFESRDDKNWVYLTLAEAYLGFKMEQEYILAVKRAKYYSEGVFDRYSFERQSIRLLNYLNEYQTKYENQ